MIVLCAIDIVLCATLTEPKTETDIEMIHTENSGTTFIVILLQQLNQPLFLLNPKSYNSSSIAVKKLSNSIGLMPNRMKIMQIQEFIETFDITRKQRLVQRWVK